MKVAATLLVCTIALVRSKNIELNANGCPIDYSNELLYPHEICNKFYQCQHGELVEHTCAAQLMFNVEKQVCDWPLDTDCGNRIIPDPECENNENDDNKPGNASNETEDKNDTCICNPSEAPSICAEFGSNGIIIANEICNRYYECANGIPVVLECLDNLLYNPCNQQCDWPQNVECGDRLIPEVDNGNTGDNGNCNNGTGDNSNGGGDNGGTSNCRPSEAHTICASAASEGIFLAHENCNQFYKCAHGIPVTFDCPRNLLYNPYIGVCDWAQNVQCGDRLIPEVDNGNNGDNGNGSGDNSNGGGNNNKTCIYNPSEAPSICGTNSGSDGVLVAHENCNQFYKCANGKPVALKCPANLLYNPCNQQCDWPQNVQCGDRLIPEVDNGNNGDNGNGDIGSGDNNNKTCISNPSEAPSICADSGFDGVIVAHENCNQFYKCAYGIPVTFECPSNLLYNPCNQQCDWPQNVQCGDRLIPEIDNCNNGDNGDGDYGSGNNNNGGGNNNETCICNPSEAPSICADGGSDGVLVAHENCNQFYECANGKPVAIKCPGNLLYNPCNQQCDWSQNVQCGDRLIPEVDNGNPGDNGNGDNGSGDNNNGGGDNDGTCNCRPGEAPTICASGGSEGVLVAHENCNQFYKCANGVPVAINCPSNLLYNPYMEQCDWPQNVQCGDRLIPEVDNGNTGDNGNGENGSGGNNNGGGDNGGTCNCRPGEAPTICASGGSDGVLVAHENCNQFYKCANGIPVAINCPGNLLYNPYKEQCDWPPNVQCGDRLIPEVDNGNTGDNGNGDNGAGDNNNGGGDNGGTCNCRPGEAPTICASGGSDGVLVAHENCNQFYKCANGVPVALKCYGDLLYNPYTEQCDWPQNVQCGDRLIPEVDNGNTGDNGNGENGSGDNNNGGEENGGTCNCRPGEAPTICASGGSEGVLVAHENCSQFYKCANGVPVAINCPSNLLYNPYMEQCDWPQNVHCGDRLIPEVDNGNTGDNGNGENGSGGNNNGGGDNGGTCNCRPGEAPTICASGGSDGVLVAHENCNQFYKCANGVPVALKCYGDLLYNPYTEQCDWPQNVQCGDRLIPEVDNGNTGDNGNGDNGSGDNNNGGGDNGVTCNCRPDEAPTICASGGSEGVLVANENCNQFYKCANGIPVAINCPGNLLYNPYMEQCDWPQNVQCGDRLIPEVDNGNTGDNGNSENGSGDNNNGGGDNGGTCNCRPGEAPTICASGGSEGVLVAHENCNQFYKCANGVPVALKCYGDLLYNPYTEQCDWPQNVQCGDRLIPEVDNGNTGDNGNGDNGSGDNNNGGGDNGVTCNCRPDEAPTICASGGSEGVLVANENCNQFYKCANGIPVAINCPGNLLYNPYMEQCDWPQNVQCGDRLIPEVDNGNTGDNGNGENGSGDNNNGGGDNGGTCNCRPGEAPTICASGGSEGVLVAHENCNQFYKCANGVPVALKCYGDLLYNPYTEQCDWPQNVQCGDRLIPEVDNGNTGDNGNGDNGSGDNNNGGGDNGVTCNCRPDEAPTICASGGSEGVLVANENCNQFYKCANGIPVAINCPGTLLYNPYMEQCDWPQNVQCGDRLIPEVDNGNTGDNGNGDNGSGDNNNGGGDNGVTCNCRPDEAPTICASGGSEGVLVANENCNQFYKCANGIPVAINCPGNLLYNPYMEQCDWPQNVQCGDRLIPEVDNGNTGDNGNGENGSGDNNNGGGDNGGTCNCRPGEAPTICASGGSEGVLVAHENCNQFYKCANGVPVALKCYGDLLYNPYTEQCDWPQNVQCGDRLIPEVDNGNTGDNGNGDNGSGDNNNGGGDNGVTCNCRPDEAPTICASGGSEGVLVANENCNQFYKCANGIPVAINCPGTLLYNPYMEQCDWPQNVQCGDRLIPEVDNGNTGDNGNGENGSGNNNNGGGDNGGTCNCRPGEAPTICASGGSEGVLVAHENCNQFYKCANGVPVALKCYGDLLYNPYTERCDWPQNVQCGDRLIPDVDNGNTDDNGNGDNGSGDNNNGGGDNGGTCNCRPDEAPTICASGGSEGVLVANENCNQFYKCANGIPVAINCPGNLLYNPYMEQCDWPQNVQCGDRLIPEVDNGNTGDNGNGENGSGDNNNGGGDNGGTCNCRPGEAPTICASGGSEGVLVAHENCNQFYKCANGVPVALKCYGDLLYNPYTEQCDWPQNVQCGDRLIPDVDNGNTGDNGNGDNGSGDNNNGGGDNGVTCNCRPDEAPTICASGGSEGVLVANENCNQFYKCANGIPVAINCPGNLLYNPYMEQCDWPQNVQCGDRLIPEVDNGNTGDNGNGENGSGDNNNGGGDNGGTCNCRPGEAPTICASGGSEGVLVAHENCNQFYKCANGLPVALQCYGDLLYNPYTEQCDWPQNVQCGDRLIPDVDNGNTGDNGNGDNGCGDNNNGGGDNGVPCNCRPDEAPTICASGGSEGVLVANENCNQFYKCANGIPVAINCPGNLLYNPYMEQCDWPQNVQCGDRLIPEVDNGNTGDNGNGENGSGDNNNEGGDNGGTCNCRPGEAPTICASGGSEGVLVAHENCNQFYKCANGVPVALKCYGDLLYNPYTEQCDWPQNVQCGDRLVPEVDNGNTGDNGNGDNGSGDNNNGDGDNGGTCNCRPDEAPTICASGGSEGVLVAHENCNQFYTCANAIPVAIICPGNLLYNPYTEQCDWPQNVQCGNRLIPEVDNGNTGGNGNGDNGSGDNNNGGGDNGGTCNCRPREAPTICASGGSDGVLVAHENCNQFYKCANGLPIALQCYGDLLYNPYTEQCDWPQNVDCKGRIK